MKSNSSDPSNSRNEENRNENRSALQGNTEGQKQEGADDDEFPGYPHYAPNEDIMHPANRMEKIAPDPENLTRSGAYVDSKNVERPVSSSMDTAADIDDDLIIVPGTEADVTKDDLIILGEQNIEDYDETDEEEAVDSKVHLGALNTGLDVPGEEQDDLNESLGEEDEENNYYSLGGDRQENLEEN